MEEARARGGVEERSRGEALSAAAASPLRGHGRRHLPCLPGASEPPTRPNRREGPSGWLARRCGISASDSKAIAMTMAVSWMCSEAVSAILCVGERFLVCAQCACWAQVSPFFRTSKTTCGETKKVKTTQIIHHHGRQVGCDGNGISCSSATARKISLIRRSSRHQNHQF